MVLEKILKSLFGLRNAQLLQNEFIATDQTWLQEFIRTVDQSPHSLLDWLNAHDVFLEWAKKNNRTIPLDRRQEYLCCTLEGMKDPAGNFSLESVLVYYLERNGVD